MVTLRKRTLSREAGQEDGRGEERREEDPCDRFRGVPSPTIRPPRGNDRSRNEATSEETWIHDGVAPTAPGVSSSVGKKRRNERAQMVKGLYYAVEESSSPALHPNQPFERASENVLASRRFVQPSARSNGSTTTATRQHRNHASDTAQAATQPSYAQGHPSTTASQSIGTGFVFESAIWAQATGRPASGVSQNEMDQLKAENSALRAQLAQKDETISALKTVVNLLTQ